jgi:hypothetical protein
MIVEEHVLSKGQNGNPSSAYWPEYLSDMPVDCCARPGSDDRDGREVGE